MSDEGKSDPTTVEPAAGDPTMILPTTADAEADVEAPSDVAGSDFDSQDTTQPKIRVSGVVAAPAAVPNDDDGYVAPDPTRRAPPTPAGPLAFQEEPTVQRMRTRPTLVPWLLLLAALAGIAFFALQRHLPMRAELEQTQSHLTQEQRNVTTLKKQVEALEAAQSELIAEVEKREKEVQALQTTQDELAERLQKEIKEGSVAISQAHGELVVDLVDKILFDSGMAEVNEGGQEVLKQVGETFLKLDDKLIRVAGHTDAVPISPKLLETYPTNWELSASRATNVVRYLQEQAKIPGKRLAIVGRSEFNPIASNASSRGRRRNRRIEVTLVPMRPRRK